jgi:hypothetical protein
MFKAKGLEDKIIYLASPYTHPDPDVVEKRFTQVMKVAADLTKFGYVIFSPILHSHPLAVEHGLNGDWDFWKRIDTAFIKASGLLAVVKLDGWDQSKGVTAEIAIAEKCGIPVEYLEVRNTELGIGVYVPEKELSTNSR